MLTESSILVRDQSCKLNIDIKSAVKVTVRVSRFKVKSFPKWQMVGAQASKCERAGRSTFGSRRRKEKYFCDNQRVRVLYSCSRSIT